MQTVLEKRHVVQFAALTNFIDGDQQRRCTVTDTHTDTQRQTHVHIHRDRHLPTMPMPWSKEREPSEIIGASFPQAECPSCNQTNSAQRNTKQKTTENHPPVSPLFDPSTTFWWKRWHILHINCLMPASKMPSITLQGQVSCAARTVKDAFNCSVEKTFINSSNRFQDFK